MTAGSYVVAGLARARRDWFRAVATWAMSGSVPVEFVKCMSGEELRAHLAAGRMFSAVLLDADLPAVDRDLLTMVATADCAPIIVESTDRGRRWEALGAVAVLHAGFTRDQLLDCLSQHAAPVNKPPAARPLPAEETAEVVAVAPLLAITGPGGTGASTCAAALAQGLASAAAFLGPVLLADCCLRADQAMLHDARDIVPGVQELVDAHRVEIPDQRAVQALTYRVVARGYHLLLGLRQARHWSTIPAGSFAAALGSLRFAFGVVVADIEPDLEGEADGGSLDIEERNAMARVVAERADVVVVVGQPGMKGLHALVRTVAGLLVFGVDAERVLPVLNQSARSPRIRAELARAVRRLLSGLDDGAAVAPPVFLPRRRVDEAQRDGVELPPPLPMVLAGACRALFERVGRAEPLRDAPPTAVVPGTLGHWPAT